MNLKFWYNVKWGKSGIFQKNGNKIYLLKWFLKSDYGEIDSRLKKKKEAFYLLV